MVRPMARACARACMHAGHTSKHWLVQAREGCPSSCTRATLHASKFTTVGTIIRSSEEANPSQGRLPSANKRRPPFTLVLIDTVRARSAHAFKPLQTSGRHSGSCRQLRPKGIWLASRGLRRCKPTTRAGNATDNVVAATTPAGCNCGRLAAPSTTGAASGAAMVLWGATNAAAASQRRGGLLGAGMAAREARGRAFMGAGTGADGTATLAPPGKAGTRAGVASNPTASSAVLPPLARGVGSALPWRSSRGPQTWRAARRRLRSSHATVYTARAHHVARRMTRPRQSIAREEHQPRLQSSRLLSNSAAIYGGASSCWPPHMTVAKTF
mmetsp:Transcript_93703/g.260866  ORF Transcript_93703/g.260866 Transcript_93703/m.260866 type:complete len:327 (+) Transcript_93703:2-982(+)